MRMRGLALVAVSLPLIGAAGCSSSSKSIYEESESAGDIVNEQAKSTHWTSHTGKRNPQKKPRKTHVNN
ncbi:MAG: hypothetical protein ACR2QL_05540 [Woeseiaceae bacterium]